ncbi:MAG: DUF805 domain-containing protein [Fusobacterium sp.]|nr:DUF805 domain-containing protein [Fusobacterium sp.]
MDKNIGILENYKKCIFQKYMQINGRASRQEYWKYTLVQMAIVMAFTIVISIFRSIGMELDFNTYETVYKNGFYKGIIYLFKGISWLYLLATLLPSFSVLARRLHDVNKPTWMALLSFSGILGSVGGVSIMFTGAFGIGIGIILFGVILSIYFIILLVKKGTEGENNYGENPYDISDDEDNNLNTSNFSENFNKLKGTISNKTKDLKKDNKKIKCISCGVLLKEDVKFCYNCGTEKKELKCICGEKLKQEDKFCSKCGNKVEEHKAEVSRGEQEIIS